MGQEETRMMLSNKPIEKITRNFFDFQYVIGKGGFGKVKKIYNIIIIIIIIKI